MSVVLKSVILVLCAVFVSSSRVLVIFPVPSKSHSIVSDSFVKILLDGGHNVTYISTSTKLKTTDRLQCINIASVDPKDTKPTNLYDFVKSPQLPRQILEDRIGYSKFALQHEDVQELLLDTEEQYDVVIAEWYYNGLLAPLAALYDCPLIWYSTEDASWMSLRMIHEQTSPVYSVDLLSSNSASGNDVWSRASRLWRQTYITARIYYTINYIESPTYQQIYKRFFDQRGVPLPDYETLVYNGSLLLINSQPIVGQRLPLPNNAKYIGGHHIEEQSKLLPQKLQDILNNSTKGVILFSLGIEISTKDLPLKMKWALMDVFGALKQTVIWKVDEYMEDLPKNVLTVKWMPQRSILNHSNTMLFINQGGFLSNMEATFFGVPVISVPFFGDQFVSSDLMVAAGRGLRVDFCEEFPQKIKEAIDHVLQNESCSKSAKFASTVLQNSLVSPSKELLYLMELVITTKGAPHLRSPAVHLTIFERLHVDIIALLFMFIWFSSKVLKVIKVHASGDETDDEKKNI